MERLVGIIPDGVNIQKTTKTEPNYVHVEPGSVQVGGSSDRFVSWGFNSCSAYIVRGRTGLYGLFHATRIQDFNDNHISHLNSVVCGEAIIVEGASSHPNSDLKKRLFREFGIRIADTIHVGDSESGGYGTTFQVCYCPSKQKILVAGSFSVDTLVFQAW